MSGEGKVASLALPRGEFYIERNWELHALRFGKNRFPNLPLRLIFGIGSCSIIFLWFCFFGLRYCRSFRCGLTFSGCEITAARLDAKALLFSCQRDF